ncbi:MAG: VPLPA-CTERM sorting domain-containing protein [Pseudomonadota bacterium]
MKRLLLSAVAGIIAANSSAYALPFSVDFSGSGSIDAADGTTETFAFDNEGVVIDNSETRFVDPAGPEGAMHVRAYGEFLGDDTYNFVNSAIAFGRATAMARTIIEIEFTNDRTVDQQITLTSTIIPGAMGLYFSENCLFNEDEANIFACAQAADIARTLAEEDIAASSNLNIAVTSNGVQTDGLTLGMQTTGGDGVNRDITTDLSGAARLEGFDRLGGVDDISDSLFYKWDESIVTFDGGMVAPGETVAIAVVFESIIAVSDANPFCDPCLSSFIGFGDPFGSGSDDGDNRTFGFGGFNTNLTASIEIDGEIADPEVVPVPGAVWLMGAGIAGLAARARKKRR